MKNKITIGLPSKGRLKDKSVDFFNNKGFKILQSDKERNYFATIENMTNVKIIYLHAKEIIQRLGDGSLDIGFSGFDLLKESQINTQKRINVVKKYEFGKANLVVAIPDPWIDVQTVADLEEIAFEFRDKKKKRLRVATKYPNLTKEFLFSKGVTQFQLVESLGATEAYPFTGSANLITDISSTGETIKSNNLRILKDGKILKSQACIFISKKKLKKKGLKYLIKLLSN